MVTSRRNQEAGAASEQVALRPVRLIFPILHGELKKLGEDAAQTPDVDLLAVVLEEENLRRPVPPRHDHLAILSGQLLRLLSSIWTISRRLVLSTCIGNIATLLAESSGHSKVA